MTSRGAARPNGQSQASKICQFKLVLLGESAVGKSSLVLRFVKGQFHEYQESTIGGECSGVSSPRKENLWPKPYGSTARSWQIYLSLHQVWLFTLKHGTRLSPLLRITDTSVLTCHFHSPLESFKVQVGSCTPLAEHVL